ncbi:MAG: hypothetical protein AAF968_04615, partial [Pseudomonadota bacterium]
HLGPRPFEVGAEVAARRIRSGIERGLSTLAFPWPLAAMAWCGARLPPALSDLAIRPFAARIAPEAHEGTVSPDARSAMRRSGQTR